MTFSLVVVVVALGFAALVWSAYAYVDALRHGRAPWGGFGLHAVDLSEERGATWAVGVSVWWEPAYARGVVVLAWRSAYCLGVVAGLSWQRLV